MKKIAWLFLFLFPVFCSAQMLVYTVAGSTGALPGDGGLATNAAVGASEGIWMDAQCNLYISHDSRRIRKVNIATGIITTIAGNGTLGYAGDNGPATDASIAAYGMYADATGNVYTAESNNNRVRRIDAATGIIITFAGGGATTGDGGAATNAQLNKPRNVYGDKAGNVYIGELGRIRKVNNVGIISTIAGTGVNSLSGDGGQATNATVSNPHTMLFDNAGNLFFADRANHRIRKISPAGIITTYAGTTDGFSGDGGPATAAQLSGPISFVIDYSGNMIIGDNQNDYLRKVDAITGIITYFAGKPLTGTIADGAPATASKIHPEFMYLDRSGNLYFSCFLGCGTRKIINCLPAMQSTGNGCAETAVEEVAQENNTLIYPNPVRNTVTIKARKTEDITILNTIGQVVYKKEEYGAEHVETDVSRLPAGMYFVKVNGVFGGRFVKE